jgi:hypothetical protein
MESAWKNGATAKENMERDKSFDLSLFYDYFF